MIVALGIVVSMRPALVSAQVCVGDCNGDGQVTVDEIILGVNISLGTSPIGDCVAFDADSSGSVTVDEIITAVNNALLGCPTGCDLSGSWGVMVTQLAPPQPPDVASVHVTQNQVGQVGIVEFPAFRGFVVGNILQVNYCDCDPAELTCAHGDLAIASGCNAFNGVLDWIEFGSQPACVFQDLNLVVDSGREQVDAMRAGP